MDKFKNDIQHKFSQREIQPTDEAWGKITGELATSRKSKAKSLWLWSGIAAGFIGLLVLLAPLYIMESTKLPVVNSEEKETTENGIKLQLAESVNRLESKGFVNKRLQFSQSQQSVPVPYYKSLEKTSEIPGRAISLLAEVEREMEQERFSQENMSEVDALLAQARAKITSQKDQQIFDQLTAEALLAEVDLEDENSLRDKIWNLIETNFKDLKSSLGSR